MPVYFAYRSFDHGPTGKYLRQFEDDTVLDWVRRHWEYLAIEPREESDERLTELLGSDGWFLINPFATAAEMGMPVPESEEALAACLHNCSDQEDTRPVSRHHFQVLTEEDGEGGAVFYFDEHFANQYPELAAYLLHEDWRLPFGVGDGRFHPTTETIPLTRGNGEGTTYVALLERESKYPLQDLICGYRIEGIRLPDLALHLCMQDGLDPTIWSGAFRRLPALMLAATESDSPMEAAFRRAVREAPQDGVNWAAWSDWRLDRGDLPLGIGLLDGALRRLARFTGQAQVNLPLDHDLGVACQRLRAMEGDRTLRRKSAHSLFHAEGHLVQTCLDTSATDRAPYFGQWYFFDDIWASAHPHLANSLLRFASRWDVLTID
jgi:hypothetical protein